MTLWFTRSRTKKVGKTGTEPERRLFFNIVFSISQLLTIMLFQWFEINLPIDFYLAVHNKAWCSSSKPLEQGPHFLTLACLLKKWQGTNMDFCNNSYVMTFLFCNAILPFLDRFQRFQLHLLLPSATPHTLSVNEMRIILNLNSHLFRWHWHSYRPERVWLVCH